MQMASKWNQLHTHTSVCVCVCVCSTKGDYVCHVKWSVRLVGEGSRSVSRGGVATEGGRRHALALTVCSIMCAEIFLFIWQKLWHTHTHTHIVIQSHMQYTQHATPPAVEADVDATQSFIIVGRCVYVISSFACPRTLSSATVCVCVPVCVCVHEWVCSRFIYQWVTWWVQIVFHVADLSKQKCRHFL